MKVLVTGSSGFLGKKIIKIFLENGTKVIVTEKEPQNNIIAMDITREEEVEKVMGKQRPDVVIHAAAITDVDWCEDHENETYKVNVFGTRNIAKNCKKFGAKMVFISTDYIFDGKKKGKYTEEDRLNPLNVYGKSKMLAESAIKEEMENYLIVRVTAIYGYNDRNDKKTFPKYIMESLLQKKEIKCFTDQYLNPTLINDVAQGIFFLLKKEQKGIFHMTGGEHLSRYDFAKKVAQVFGLDGGLVKPGMLDESGLIAKRPKKIDTSIEKLERHGFEMSDATLGLLKMKNDMKNSGFVFS